MGGLIFLTLIIVPIVFLALIISGIIKSNTGEQRVSFSSVFRMIYMYLVSGVMLISMLFSIIAITNSAIEIALPYRSYNDQSSWSVEERENQMQQTKRNLTTASFTFLVATPLFIYHIRQSKKS